MRNIVVFLLVMSSFHHLNAQNVSPSNVSRLWDQIDKKIVNKSIDKDRAVELLEYFEPMLKEYFRQNGGIRVERKNWVFPLKNYTSIYFLKSGKGYRKRKYDYFQGTNTKGHPAYDIRILDANKDLLDDVTLKPVDVVSMSSGVVVSTDTTWRFGSRLRGGRYVKVFDVTNNGLFYYSHLSQITVEPGDVIGAGEKIGEVGRTGRYAVSPHGNTHLHIGFLNSNNGYPVPQEIIEELRNAEGNSIESEK